MQTFLNVAILAAIGTLFLQGFSLLKRARDCKSAGARPARFTSAAFSPAAPEPGEARSAEELACATRGGEPRAPVTAPGNFAPTPEKGWPWAGWLTWCLAVVGALASWMLLSNKLLIAPEFRLMLVEGTWNCGLRVLLVLICIAGALLVQSARASFSDEAEHHRWTLLFAFLGSPVLAVFLVQSVHANGIAGPRLYAYPLLAPPIAAFLGWALLEWSMVVFRIRSHATRAWLSMLALTALAAFGWTQSNALPWAAASATWWAAVAYTSLGRAIYLLAQKLLPMSELVAEVSPRRKERFVAKAEPYFRGFLALAIAAVAVTLIADGPDASRRTWRLSHPIPLIVVTGSLCVITVAVHVRQGWGRLRQDYGHLLRTAPRGLAVLPFVLGLSDLMWWRYFEPRADIALTLVSLALMVEVTAGTPLTDLSAESSIRHGWRMLTPVVDLQIARAWAGVRGMNWKVALVLVIVLYRVQVAWSQRNALLVEEFETQGIEENQKWLGRALADEVAHEVKRLSSLMRNDPMHQAVLGCGSTAKDDGLSASDIVVDDDDDVLRGDVETGVLKIGSWGELPVGIVFAPLQRPLRAVLGTRAVRGSLEQGDEQYRLLATVDGWGGFQAHGPSARRSAELLATRLFIAQPQLRRLGVSDHHAAARAFFQGMEAWRRYRKLADAGGGDGERALSVERFRAAVHLDPTAAAAQYRLGIALWEDNQVVAAADAFRGAIRARPELPGPYIALAKMLLRVGSAAERTITVATREPLPSLPDLGAGRRDEAERLLLRALALPAMTRTEEAAARLQYCALITNQEPKSEGQYYRAFYNCSRADVLYSGISEDLQRRAQRAFSAHLKARLVVAEATARAQPRGGVTGVIPPAKQRGTAPLRARAPAAAPWGCSAARFMWAGGRLAWYDRPYAGTERALYWARKALALEPDNPTYLCEEARLQLALGNERPMLALWQNPYVQTRLGDELSSYAWFQEGARTTSNALFAAALDAYSQAIQASGADPNLANDWAYTFRLWSASDPQMAMSVARSALETTRGIRAATQIFQQHPKDRRAMRASTLGEALIAQGFFHTAVDVLSRAQQDLGDDSPATATHNELRWDLAQAMICAQAEDELAMTAGAPCDHGDSASKVLRAIHEVEAGREYRPFSSWRFRHVASIRATCPIVPALPSRVDVIHFRPEIRRSYQPVTAMLRYRLHLPPDAQGDIDGPIGLHVWSGNGDEVEGSIDTHVDSAEVLPLPEQHGHLAHDPVLLRAHWTTRNGEKRSTEPLSVYPCSDLGCATSLSVVVEHAPSELALR